ncbi:uncharacterized protein CBL_05483 [Carabus blaptoides fortunei]
MPHEIKSVKEFNEQIAGGNLVVVHFSAKWADQCSHVNDVLDELAKQDEFVKSAVKFCCCEAEDLAEVSLQYKIEAAPTILLFKCGKVVDRVDGADVGQLTAKVKQHQNAASAPVPASAGGISLEERLKQLVNKHHVMIFMKGNRENPRCGFSKQLVHIMSDIGVAYDTFDILQDEEVRQGLKVYADWPTYPQLYVKGELIGGLDIIKEMQTAGELQATLTG